MQHSEIHIVLRLDKRRCTSNLNKDKNNENRSIGTLINIGNKNKRMVHISQEDGLNKIWYTMHMVSICLTARTTHVSNVE